MGSLLDAIGALSIGGLLLITMFNALFNVQSMGFNADMYTTLNKISEDATYVISARYLSILGAGVSTSAAIDSAKTDVFQFKGILDGSVRTICMKTLTHDPDKGYPLIVNVDGSLEFGPFYIDEDAIFTFLDDSNSAISFVGGAVPAVSLPDIRAVEVDLTFFKEDIYQDDDKPDLFYKMVFWKYFKNMYI